ncbi:sigma-70 region 4 domain-containing protein [Streptomyces sp. NBC_01476]|uniref:helix-turn-helix domain-containing protein n=1 Tax=Streptomyces sp. NBC_01476 TaxID=2903881 RepID=UPI002E31C9D0|nr:helix-turn-helix domain-containing protein [Streptomyces sp. NBC_01476]
MHDPLLRRQAVTLCRSGVPNAEVGRRLGIPSGTIGYWLHQDRAARDECPGRERPCHRCDGAPLDTAAYGYLLGLYLGDGHIVQYSRHRVPNLMITCADSWPGLMDSAEAALRAVFPHNKTCRVSRTGCHNVKVYSRHLWCMFPQHGPGKKHERRIVLEPWQQKIVDAHPWEFIRGLVHSDGCRVTNWTERTVGGVRKRYEYPRYFFTNTSADIRQLYCDTLDMVGVRWRVTRRGDRPYNISVARAASVALMDRHVGPKF